MLNTSQRQTPEVRLGLTTEAHADNTASKQLINFKVFESEPMQANTFQSILQVP